MRIKHNSYVVGFFVVEYVQHGVDKTKDGRGVLPLRIDPRVANERVIRAKNECVCIEQKELVRNILRNHVSGAGWEGEGTQHSPEIHCGAELSLALVLHDFVVGIFDWLLLG